MCVIQHIYIIAILFNFLSEISNKVSAATQPLFTRLTNEIQSLRKEFHASKKEKKKIKTVIMPTQPFKEIQPFLEFEKGLQEIAENFTSFVSSILNYTQKNASVKKN